MTPVALPPLDREERRALLSLARRSIIARLDQIPLPGFADAPARLRLSQAAFVSLHLDGELRGCIGSLAPSAPLFETVASCAAAAAVDDPRFPPLPRVHVDPVEIEISVLGPFAAVPGRDAIVVGRHGIMVTLGHRRGLLLPQVASRRRWDAETLLGEACIKAGLARDAWRNGARVEMFEAEVFAENGDRQ